MKIEKLPIKENPIRNKWGKIWIEDGIVHWNTSGEEITIEAAKKNIEIVKEITKPLESPKKLIIFMAGGKVPYESRKLFKESLLFIKVALVANSPTTQVVAAFFKGLNKFGGNLSIFTNEKDALLWLNDDR